MAMLLRHGGEAHVVRPDRVYRTSVLTPIVGFQPQADVQAVARAFTQGPPSGMTLDGLSDNAGGGWVTAPWYFFSKGMNGLGASRLGPIARLRLRMRARAAARRGRGAQFFGLGSSPGPSVMEAHGIAPQIAPQMAMLMHLTRANNPQSVFGPVAEAADTLAARRPYEFYYAG